MLKKNILLFALMIGCSVNVVAIASQSQKKVEAFRINRFDSHHECDIRNGIASTTKIKGVDAWRWLHAKDKIDPQGMYVVEQLGANKFGEAKELSQFNQKGLDSCDFALGLYGEEYIRDVYQAHYVKFITSLQDRTCYLCIYGDKQVIVINAQGMPESVCNKLFSSEKEQEKRAEIDQKFKENISKSWRQAEKEKKRIQELLAKKR